MCSVVWVLNGLFRGWWVRVGDFDIRWVIFVMLLLWMVEISLVVWLFLGVVMFCFFSDVVWCLCLGWM